MMAATSQWLDAFVFLRPWWLLALPGVAVAWWAWRRRMARASPWHGVVDPALQPHVLDGVAAGGRLPPWRWTTLYLLAVLALAGPAWNEAGQPVLEVRDPLVVVLDLSSSSHAADLSPDRATRARLKLARLLEIRQGGQLGLLAFAGSAHVVAPLTRDHRTLRRLVDALEPGLMPVDGHRLDLGIERATALLQGAGEPGGRIVVMTDRADPAATAAARHARASGYTVQVIGLGTVDGAPVRAPSGGFSRDTADRLRMARLDTPGLERLAAAGGGHFMAMRADDTDLQGLGLLDTWGAGAAESDAERRVVEQRDEGFWLVLLMLPLLLPEFRRGGALALSAVLLLMPAAPASAMDPSALFKRDDQRAWEALVEGHPERALELARDPALRGAAAFRNGDFDLAAEAFAEAGGVDGTYNRGNALAASGRHEEALQSWRDVLESEPAHGDARANLEALEQWLAEQPPPGPQGNDTGEGDGEGDAGPESSAADGAGDAPAPEAGEEEAPAPGDADPRDGSSDMRSPGEPDADAQGEADAADAAVDPADRAAAEQAVREAIEEALQSRTGEPESASAGVEAMDPEALADREEAEAIERWLRQVDDDPGALLRRKFMIEHQRGQRSGGNR